MSESMTSYRPLNDWERRIILRLLHAGPFAGRDDLLHQIENAAARSIDEDGSISLKCSPTPKARVRVRIPVEGEAQDTDGVVIHYLLHVVDGIMDELEVYKDDSSGVLRQAEPEEVMVINAG
jgi:hypothetical protein